MFNFFCDEQRLDEPFERCLVTVEHAEEGTAVDASAFFADDGLRAFHEFSELAFGHMELRLVEHPFHDECRELNRPFHGIHRNPGTERIERDCVEECKF